MDRTRFIFVLLAAVAVAVMGAAYWARDDASAEAARSEPPMTRRQFKRYVFALALRAFAIQAARANLQP